VCVTRYSKRFSDVQIAGGNLMSAADCPTKRAAFMTDMTLGRWSHVPARMKLLYKLSVSGCLGLPKV